MVRYGDKATATRDTRPTQLQYAIPYRSPVITLSIKGNHRLPVPELLSETLSPFLRARPHDSRSHLVYAATTAVFAPRYCL